MAVRLYITLTSYASSPTGLFIQVTLFTSSSLFRNNNNNNAADVHHETPGNYLPYSSLLTTSMSNTSCRKKVKYTYQTRTNGWKKITLMRSINGYDGLKGLSRKSTSIRT